MLGKVGCKHVVEKYFATEKGERKSLHPLELEGKGRLLLCV